jgi:hypothetical protein
MQWLLRSNTPSIHDTRRTTFVLERRRPAASPNLSRFYRQLMWVLLSLKAFPSLVKALESF